MAIGLLSSVLNVIIFIGILWNVGGDLNLQSAFGQLIVPKYMVVAVLIYSALLTFTMTVIGRRMVPVIAAKNAAEAQFRSIASSWRERGESAVPADDTSAPHRLVSEAFGVVVKRWRAICAQFMRITVVAHGNSLAAPIVGWFLCAPQYLAGTMSLGESAQTVAAFVTVQGALNWLVDNYGALAECLSSVNRVAALLLALDDIDRSEAVAGSADMVPATSPTPHRRTSCSTASVPIDSRSFPPDTTPHSPGRAPARTPQPP
jgi:putative ATP-binding cassette transporter